MMVYGFCTLSFGSNNVLKYSPKVANLGWFKRCAKKENVCMFSQASSGSCASRVSM